MKDLFVNYELALLAKVYQFDEPCLYAYCEKGGWNKYTGKREEITLILKTDGNPFGTFFIGKNWNNVTSSTKNKIQCSAPLYQQLTDWFREKHNIAIELHYQSGTNGWSYCYGHNAGKWYFPKDTYEYYESYSKAIEEAFKLIKLTKRE